MMRWQHSMFVVALLLLAGHLPAQQEEGLQRQYAEAQQALAAGDMGRALQLFTQLSHANPKLAELHATLGALRYQQGDYAGALEELTAARKLKPTLPKLDGLIAMCQAELGHFQEALPRLEVTFKTSADPQVKRMSGLELERVYSALDRDSDAVRVALELDRLYPKDPEVLYHNERIFGNYAFVTVQRLAQVAPDSVWRLQAEAEAYESQGSLDQAIAAYKQILDRDPGHHGMHYRIGRCYQEKARQSHGADDLAAAMQEYQAELKLEPNHANAAYEIGELHRTAGELEQAQEYFARAVQISPEFPEANLGLGTVLAALGQPAAALPYLKRAVAGDPSDEASWYRLAQVERSLGDTAGQQAAMQEFQRLHKASLAARMAPQVRDVSRQEIAPDAAP
ncbi:MAG: tetratricopeptide repeat protein [Acidobacteriota bacterium]|nr:tetratricopeptide repeat protein [Acidobacteriota bacterium]